MKQSQRTQLLSRAQKVQTRIESLVSINLGMLTQSQIDCINETIEELRLESSRIDKAANSLKTYLFNFIGGGWNSVQAITEEIAIEIASQKYNDIKTQVDVKTFRESTPGDYNNLLSLFY
jgi:hypothetical protein